MSTEHTNFSQNFSNYYHFLIFMTVNARESLKKKKKKQMARIRSSQGALNDQNLESKIHQKPFPLLRPIGRSYDLVSFQELGQLYYLRFFHVLLIEILILCIYS